MPRFSGKFVQFMKNTGKISGTFVKNPLYKSAILYYDNSVSTRSDGVLTLNQFIR